MMDREKIIFELRKTYETMWPMSKSLLEKDGELMSVLFGLTLKGIQTIGLLFDNHETKWAAYRKLREELDAYGAVLINECWFLDELTDEEKRQIRETRTMKIMPSDHSKRKEGVSCLLVTYGWSEFHLHPFIRDGKTIIWQPDKPRPDDGILTNEIFPAFDEGVH